MKKPVTPLSLSRFVVAILVLVYKPIAVSDPVPGSFADCVVDNSGSTPFLVCDNELIDIRRSFDDALLRIKAREVDAINTSGIYERYLHQLSDADQSQVENLSELSNMLALEYPELYGSFVIPYSVRHEFIYRLNINNKNCG